MSNEHLGVDLLMDGDGELVVSPSGDLAITRDGRVCLLQDIAHLLETPPGDLFSHPEYGSGLGRLLGDSRPANLRGMVERTITDALAYSPQILFRIQPDEIHFEVRVLDEHEIRILLQVAGMEKLLKV